MSIEKLSDLSVIRVEKTPYTQICNQVIDNVKDNDAFRLYVYLSSKSREWVVVKEWTAQKCLTGERKAKQCWSYLERCGLIEYVRVRDSTGKFNKHDMRVLNGSRFNPDEPFLKSTGADSAPVAIHWCNNPPSGETTRVGFAPLLKKDITNKDFKQKKEKSFSPLKLENEKKHEWAQQKESLKSHVTKQSTSYNRERMMSEHTEPSPLLREQMEKDKKRRNVQNENSAPSKEPNKLLTGTKVQSEMASDLHPCSQGADMDDGRPNPNPPPVRSSHGLLEARSACSYLEEIGLASGD